MSSLSPSASRSPPTISYAISPTTPRALLVSSPNGGTSGKRYSPHRSGEGLSWGRGTLTLRFPSAVIRSRLQVPQKCSDMDVMKLTWPRKPGTLKAWGEEGKKGRGGDKDGWAEEGRVSLPGTRAPTPNPSPEVPQERSTQGPQRAEDSDRTDDP